MTDHSILKPVGILGGSFDPVHIGHLRLALECMQGTGLEKVIFMPLNTPPHRAPLQATSGQRYHMLELATVDNGDLLVSDLEIKRNDTTYTIDTLKQLRENLGQQPLCLILGMDAFQQFDSWKDWQNITDFAHLIIANRPDTNQKISKDSLSDFYNSRLIVDKEGLQNSSCGHIFRLDVPMLDISSSRIRDLLHAKHSVKYLVPDKVLEFINKERMY